VLLTRVEIGGKKFLQATVRDVSSEKTEEEKYRALFNGINDSVFIHDMAAHFLEINDAACKRLGYTREELIKMGPQKIDSPKFAKMVPGRIKELKEKGRAVFESAHVTKDGKEIPVEISSKVITYAGKPAILSVARDISGRKTMR
jgi:PAS domain S-box-containing protein